MQLSLSTRTLKGKSLLSMRFIKSIIVFLFCLSFSLAFCQGPKPLTKSRQSSFYTYIYKLKTADVLNFYKYPDKDLNERILAQPIDSFKTDITWVNHLPPGNYLKVCAEKNTLSYKLIENHSAYLKVIRNNYDLRFIITDSIGKRIENAKVLIKNKPVNFDAKTNSYHTKLSTKAVVEVDYKGVSNFYPLQIKYSYLRPFLSANWFKFNWYRVKRLFKKKYNGYSKDYRYQLRLEENEKYTGFMVFNKPMYKELDTVKVKAFILNRKSKKPVEAKHLLVRVQERYDDNGKIIGYADSYRDGGFEYSFVLADSLRLDLDRDYYLSFEDPSGAKYDLDKYDGDDDDDKFLANRKVYIAGKFRFEDYELKSTSFNIRTDKKEHEPGNPVSVYLKATDENDLPVQDGRVELNLVTRAVGRVVAAKAFVPDTLWRDKAQLEPLGETKITIPDSIFPKAYMSYEIEAQFLNADNEERNANLNITYNYDFYKITADLVSDTLKIKGLVKGKITKLLAKIYALNDKGDTLSTIKTTLPANIIVNPNIKNYSIATDSVQLMVNMASFNSDLEYAGYQTADSLFVKVNNPHHIHFWYWLINNNKLIDEGEADSLFYKKRYTDKGSVTFVVSNIWAGDANLSGIAIPYKDKLLDIKVKQPISVYPGQTVQTDIEVKDAAGKAVANADITAWALTRKFADYKAPFVPYLGKSYPALKAKPVEKIDNAPVSSSSILNWKKWGQQMGLDSIVYFLFTHPNPIFKIEEPAPDSVTQVAPFVTHMGNIEQVHILYIDNRPVYFDQAQQLARYSFKVSPGTHSFKFRTFNKNISIDSITVEKGKKLILSLNDDTLVNKAIRVKIVPDTLSSHEANLINAYMIRVADNFELKMATLEQNDNLYLLNPNPVKNTYSSSNNDVLVGPLPGTYATFALKDEFHQTFLAESGYTYQFEAGFLKQKSIKTKYPFDTRVYNGSNPGDYTQYALTKAEVDNMWQRFLDLRSHTTPLFKNERTAEPITGRLSITTNVDANNQPFIKNIIIYKEGNPDFIRIYPGNQTNLGQLVPGNYRLFFLLEKDGYFILDNVSIKPYGVNYYHAAITPRPKDAVSVKIDSVITNRTGWYQADDNSIYNDALKLKEIFNDRYVDRSSFGNVIQGRVIGSDDKLPVVGCTVKVKGTSYGAMTDVNGRFAIKVPKSGSLIFSYIGYVQQQVSINPGAMVEISLTPASSSLNEVVVTGYTSVRKKDLAASVSVVTSTGAAGIINIRGIGSTAAANPLIVMDGVVVDSMDGIDASKIGEMTTLKDAAAMAIYGSRGANGVIIITTKKQTAASSPDDQQQGDTEATLRKNFSDYAYWQPKLTTDADGKASFTTTFPDDITNWRTFVIGINGQQQTGFADAQIKSFKPLSANLTTPLFAVAGDELNMVGKVLNYGVDAVKITRTFIYNDKPTKQDAFEVKNSKIDTLNVTATNTDSLTFEYSIKRENGYFDGERRKIPVIKQGVEETKGVFEALNKDTTINMQFDPALGPVTFRAEASVLPALAEEASRLREYKYLCNEQLASKLKGLLSEKRICKYLAQPFKYEKNILDIIKKLQENRRSQGTWGWWKDTDEELWISLHAVEALMAAKDEGYMVEIDEKKLTDYLVYQLESYKGEEKLACLQLLHKLQAKVDYSKYFDVIVKEFAAQKWVSKYDQFRLILLREETGQPVKLDSLLGTEKHTLFGNVYWGEDSYRFFDNSIQLSILAYKILKIEGKHPDLLTKIRGYFLEQRRLGEWRNTYESSLILETILPDLLTGDKQVKPSSITITGAKTETVTSFPYTATITDNQISVSKTGGLPVYVTGYQQFWNPKPEKVSKEFTVDTWFEKNSDKITTLKAGEPVALKAEVTVKGDADYVMIEVPIPAGCSYQSKEQSWENNEVHREFFKEKVSIFCRKLKQGKYEFTINLMPRYSGKYNLNPAKAEMMYFPVFYGREGMRKVVISSLVH